MKTCGLRARSMPTPQPMALRRHATAGHHLDLPNEQPIGRTLFWNAKLYAWLAQHLMVVITRSRIAAGRIGLQSCAHALLRHFLRDLQCGSAGDHHVEPLVGLQALDGDETCLLQPRSVYRDSAHSWNLCSLFGLAASGLQPAVARLRGQTLPSASRMRCGVNGIALTLAPSGASASLMAFITAPGAPAVPASPAPFAPISDSRVGVTT